MFEGPLTEKAVHLCVDMQRIFQDGLWRTPWMTRVLPVVTEIAGRFRTAPCRDKHPYACANGPEWLVTRAVGPQDRGAKACAKEFPGSTYAVPGSGAHAAALRAAASTAVWLAYTNSGDGWRGTAA